MTSFETSRKEDGTQEHTRVLLFCPLIAGHHSGHIQYLIEYWYQNNLQCDLFLATKHGFLDRCDLLLPEENEKGFSLTVIYLGPPKSNLGLHYSSLRQKQMYSFWEWRELRKIVKIHRISHAHVMYMDTSISAAIVTKKIPCMLSGVFFRPLRHYVIFPGHRWTLRTRLWFWRDKLYQFILSKTHKFDMIFTLDPTAVSGMKALFRKTVCLHLPEPMLPQHTNCSKEENAPVFFKNQNAKITFLLFGSLEERKGVLQILEAVGVLEESVACRVRIIIAGALHVADKARFERALKRANETPVEIVYLNRYFNDEEIHTLFMNSDVILTLYLYHIGMSGILVKAAGAAKPVLSTNYGLLGHLVKKHRLGLCVDSSDPHEIAAAIHEMVSNDAETYCDLKQMIFFAQGNTPEAFSSTIYNALLCC